MKNKLYKVAIALPNGKRKWLSSTNKEELDRKKQELMMQLGMGVDFDDTSTFGEYAEIWLRVYKAPYLRKNSMLALKNALENHIYPYLYNVPLKKISQYQIQMVVAPLATASKSLNDKVVQALRGIFNAAVDNNLIAKSPVPSLLRVAVLKRKKKTP